MLWKSSLWKHRTKGIKTRIENMFSTLEGSLYIKPRASVFSLFTRMSCMTWLSCVSTVMSSSWNDNFITVRYNSNILSQSFWYRNCVSVGTYFNNIVYLVWAVPSRWTVDPSPNRLFYLKPEAQIVPRKIGEKKLFEIFSLDNSKKSYFEKNN